VAFIQCLRQTQQIRMSDEKGSYTGIDSFRVRHSSGIKQEMTCLACGSACEVERDLIGPTSYISAMGKVQTPHDHWYCPFSQEEWHKQLVKMYKESVETSSPSLARLIRADMDALIDEHLPN